MRLCARRWPLYLGVSAAVIAVQCAVVASQHFSPFALLVSDLLLSPVVAATVTVNVAADRRGDADSIPRTTRILERLWAVIVIELVQWFVYAASLGGVDAAGGLAYLGALLLGVLGFMLLAGIIYADADACLENPVRTLTLVPFAFVRSLSLAFADPRRALAVLFVNVAVNAVLVGSTLLGLQYARGSHPDLWINSIFGTLFVVPVSAFTTVVYLDLVESERKAAR